VGRVQSALLSVPFTCFKYIMTLRINRSALVMHSSQEMYALVNDVPAYPVFLPWCSRAEVLESGSAHMLARVEVSKGGVRQAFTTRNDLSVADRIEMELVEGPFDFLRGVWEFRALREDACKVALTLDFELKKSITKVAFGPVFNQAANSMVDAFCSRAKQVYG